MQNKRDNQKNLGKVETNFPNPKYFFLSIVIVNNTSDDFYDITIQHRTNDHQFDIPNTVFIPLLKHGESIVIEKWPFGKNAPSKASNVLFNAIPFVGWIVPIIRGWGKDYWSFFCKTSKINQLLTTDSWAQKWFANIFESDINDGATVSFNWNQERNLYWVSIYRLSNGQSTHYLDAKGGKDPRKAE